jgi:small-conductance mechanosensitive channel
LALQNFVNSFKRFVFVQLIIIILTFFCVYLFDQLIAGQTGLNDVIHQVGRILIVIVFGSIAILVIRSSKPLLSKHVGVPSATVFQFLMITITVIIMIFAFLHILHVEPSTLLIGGGIVSIVFGFIVSTSVGNLFAGTFVLMTHPYKVGDTILINNIPCKVEKITSFVTRVKNDVGGQIAIPNTAIMQGSVIVTSFGDYDKDAVSRLPYAKGDRIYTTYLNQEGVVTDITPFHTRIILDSGKELTFLNTSVLTGTVAVARIHDKKRIEH